MSQDDALFRRMLDNDPASHNANTQKSEPEESSSFPTGSNVRNVCFAWPDGRKLFLNYSYLVSGEYIPDQAAIVLAFTTHTISLKGVMLESLFDDLLAYIPKVISCTDARYNALAGEKEIVVNEICVEKLM
jgi:hypothetical protein